MFSFHTKMSLLKAVITKNSPFYIQFYVTGKCNLRCRHCGIVNANKKIRDVTLDEIEKIADNLVEIGAGVVVLMGGEPFLRKDYPQIVKIFVDRGLDVRLQTAGMRVATPEMLEKCVKAGAKDINISLDTLDPRKQDYINRARGSWDNAIKTIAHVSQLFPKKDAFTCFGTVLSAFNYAEIPVILKLATRIGWHLSLVPVHIRQPDETMAYRSSDSEFLVDEKDFNELENVFSSLHKMRKQDYNLFDSKKYLESSLEFMKTGQPTWRYKGVCDSPNLYFAIRPNGDFAICADKQLKENQVSVIDPDFPGIFKSKEFRKETRKVTSQCKGCQYGSYPEMTISSRYPSGMLNRLMNAVKVQKCGIKAYTYEELIQIIDEVKSEHPEVYDIEKNMHKYNNWLIYEKEPVLK